MLEIRDLSIRIGPHEIVSVEELDLPRGRRLGLVGESGSGKTMTAMSIAGLQPREARVSGSIRLDGRELVGLSDRELAGLRGAEIGVVFQDPLRALNPMMRIGKQIAEAVRLHGSSTRSEVRDRVVELLGQVHLPDPTNLLRRYPHQLSGGQQQRVLIAMAIACRPKLLIADEPTTALDVTVQKGILDLILELSRTQDMALLFVSHDLGVVQAVSDHMAVLYGGHLVETGPAVEVINSPRHRYPQALIAASPGQVAPEDLESILGRPLDAIEGSVPGLGRFPAGCPFRGRCPHEIDNCATQPPIVRVSAEHRHKCVNPAIPVGAELDEAVH